MSIDQDRVRSTDQRLHRSMSQSDLNHSDLTRQMDVTRHNTHFTKSGRDDPGQLGPMSVKRRAFTYAFALTMSLAGMPSVMATMTSILRLQRPYFAPAANRGGTKSWWRSHCVFLWLHERCCRPDLKSIGIKDLSTFARCDTGYKLSTVFQTSLCMTTTV